MCLRATSYCGRFSRKPRGRFSRQAPWSARSIATNSLRDGCLQAVVPTETTSSQPPEAPPSHARRRRTPPSAAAPRPSFRPWTPWWAAWLFAAASAQTASLLGWVLVGGAREAVVLGWSRGGGPRHGSVPVCARGCPFVPRPTSSRGRTRGGTSGATFDAGPGLNREVRRGRRRDRYGFCTGDLAFPLFCLKRRKSDEYAFYV